MYSQPLFGAPCGTLACIKMTVTSSNLTVMVHCWRFRNCVESPNYRCFPLNCIKSSAFKRANLALSKFCHWTKLGNEENMIGILKSGWWWGNACFNRWRHTRHTGPMDILIPSIYFTDNYSKKGYKIQSLNVSTLAQTHSLGKHLTFTCQTFLVHGFGGVREFIWGPQSTSGFQTGFQTNINESTVVQWCTLLIRSSRWYWIYARNQVPVMQLWFSWKPHPPKKKEVPAHHFREWFL